MSKRHKKKKKFKPVSLTSVSQTTPTEPLGQHGTEITKEEPLKVFEDTKSEDILPAKLVASDAKTAFVKKDIRKIILTFGTLLLLFVAIYVLNQQTGLLDKLIANVFKF